MKKFCVIITVFISFMLIYNELAYGSNKNRDIEKNMQQDISKKLIRFHILANSDSDEDQKLKLKVKDEVLKLIAPELKNCKSIDESRNILKKKDAKIKALAERIINKNGYKYKVRTELTRENFPVKTYGIITLPQGSYEAYRILIGDAEGHNWWCVMFPPLCFIDVTKGEVAEKKTNVEMKKVLNQDELSYISNDTDDNKVQLKFKIVELLKKITK